MLHTGVLVFSSGDSVKSAALWVFYCIRLPQLIFDYFSSYKKNMFFLFKMSVLHTWSHNQMSVQETQKAEDIFILTWMLWSGAEQEVTVCIWWVVPSSLLVWWGLMGLGCVSVCEVLWIVTIIPWRAILLNFLCYKLVLNRGLFSYLNCYFLVDVYKKRLCPHNKRLARCMKCEGVSAESDLSGVTCSCYTLCSFTVV